MTKSLSCSIKRDFSLSMLLLYNKLEKFVYLCLSRWKVPLYKGGFYTAAFAASGKIKKQIAQNVFHVVPSKWFKSRKQMFQNPENWGGDLWEILGFSLFISFHFAYVTTELTVLLNFLFADSIRWRVVCLLYYPGRGRICSQEDKPGITLQFIFMHL